MEDNFHNVVIPMPVLREHPFAADKRRKLARHSQTRLLVTNDTILRKDTFADHHGIGRCGCATASCAIPGHARGIENVRLEPPAIPKEIAGAKKRQDQESDNEPGRKQLCALSRAIRLAQELIMLFTRSASCGVSFVGLLVTALLKGFGFRQRIVPLQGEKIRHKQPGVLAGYNFIPGPRRMRTLEAHHGISAGLASDSSVFIKEAIRRACSSRELSLRARKGVCETNSRRWIANRHS